jgi:glucose-specific phosphotransferase system IIA component
MDLIFCSPLSGPVVPLEEVPDPIFAQRMAGDGLAIDPLDQRLLSPCNGTVTKVHRNRHAVALTTDEGVKILIHIGIETVGLDGEGFQVRVSEGQRVSKGDLLVEFDADVIARKAKSLITVVLVTNSDRFHPTNPFQGVAEAGTTPLFLIHTKDQHPEAVAPAVDRALPRVESSPIVADRFAAIADFFSIGSNDLTQYILAIDRGHPMLGRRLDSLGENSRNGNLRTILHSDSPATPDLWQSDLPCI